MSDVAKVIALIPLIMEGLDFNVSYRIKLLPQYETTTLNQYVIDPIAVMLTI